MMVAGSYPSATGRPGPNWAGNIAFTAERVHRPSTVEELQRLVAGTRHIRALGTAHSFNRIADGPGDLVSVADITESMRIDRDAGRVTIPAGIRYGELAQQLNMAGFALGNLGPRPHISVAGAVATGTHGSGVRNANLAAAVTDIEMVTATGDLVKLDRSAPDFRASVVALGALGIVARLTLEIVP